MTRFIASFALVLSLAGCVADGTNPFDDGTSETTTATTANSATASGTTTSTATSTSTDTTTDGTTTDSGSPISSNRTVLPGTASPSASGSLFRREASTGDNAEVGDGFAQDFAYDGATDTFTVDNLAFDGEDPYTAVRDSAGNRLGVGPFSAFEAPATAADSLTLASIDQLNYRALYGVGPDGNTSIAIVRTGAYVEYGFGGFIFQRNGSVTLPTSGQARYAGTDNYGGLRDFKSRGGLEYVSGDIEVNIDFDDFNEGAAVRGKVTNRRVFDLDGNDVTTDILTALGDNPTQLPVLQFVIEPGVLDSNGEITGEVQSGISSTGLLYEEGNYYAVLSGDNANTIAGVIVVEANDPRYESKVRETAGFFAARP